MHVMHDLAWPLQWLFCMLELLGAEQEEVSGTPPLVDHTTGQHPIQIDHHML